mgnify:CR=1 FL=1
MPDPLIGENAEELKRRITMLIDDSTNNWAKIAFYSDPNVARILDLVYGRWEQNNRKGLPIDYATIDELHILVHAAEKYKNAGPEVVSRLMFSSETDTINTSSKKKKKSFIKRLLGL